MSTCTIVGATEITIKSLLNSDCNWSALIAEMISVAASRKRAKGMEVHHLEPERKETIFLYPLEHLAIHICHAKDSPSDSFNAKVAAFVRAFPGGWRRIITLPEDLTKEVLNLGQSRPSNKGKGKLLCIHEAKDEQGRSLAARRATKASVRSRQIPVKVTNLETKEVVIYPSVKKASEATGIYRQNLSSYLTGYVSYLPTSVRNKYTYEIYRETNDSQNNLPPR